MTLTSAGKRPRLAFHVTTGSGEHVLTFGEYLDRSREEGLKEGQQKTLLRQLRRKFSAVPPPVVARVESADMDTLDRWLDRILTAGSLDEVFAGSPG